MSIEFIQDQSFTPDKCHGFGMLFNKNHLKVIFQQITYQNFYRLAQQVETVANSLLRLLFEILVLRKLNGRFGRYGLN